MSLPRITPYPMPTPSELPPNRVAWRPDPDRALLLVHDMQRHFLAPFEHDREPIPALFANIGALRDRCAALSVPIVYSAQPADQSNDERGLLRDFWGDGIVGSENAEVVPQVAPGEGATVMTKWRYSAFVATDLLEQMRAHDRDQLLVCGVYGHIGCLMSATHAFMEGIEPFLVADAIADFSAAEHERALAWGAGRCALVTTTAELLEALGGGEPAADGRLGRERLRADLEAALPEPVEELADEDSLIDLGLDSIALTSVVALWRERGVPITLEDLIETEPTLANWWPLFERAQGDPART